MVSSWSKAWPLVSNGESREWTLGQSNPGAVAESDAESDAREGVTMYSVLLW